MRLPSVQSGDGNRMKPCDMVKGVSVIGGGLGVSASEQGEF